MPATQPTTDRRVAIIKALAHPTRLRIAQFLTAGERCVHEIHSHTGGDLSTTSKHLTLMRKAGWLSCEKRGLHIYYRLSCDCLDPFLHCIDTLAESSSNCC